VGVSSGLSWTSGPLAGPISVIAEGDMLFVCYSMCILKRKVRDEKAQTVGRYGRRDARKLNSGRIDGRSIDRSPCTDDGIAHVKVNS
jgi:hypothetical protein